MEQEATYVGIDVAKARVDVAVRPDRRQMVNYHLRRGRGTGTGLSG